MVRGKAKHQVCTQDGINSVLPDETICHILSFMPTKDGVRTSVLSKRWRYLWTSVPVIEIDDRSVISDVRWGMFENPEIEDRFMDFVDRVLRLNSVSCLQKFSISLAAEYDVWRVCEWIRIVITRNVEVLDLDFNWEEGVELPSSLFTCRKLVFLKLTSLYLLDVPTSVCLPSLKILHVHSVELAHEDSMKNLLEGCPILEELDIKSVYNDDMKTLFVRSTSLKSLKIDFQDVCAHDIDLGIVVDARNLGRLDLNCDVTEQCDLYNLSSLVEVKLNYCWYSPDSEDVYGNKSVELLRKMSNTKYMCLNYYPMKTLEHSRLENMPMFHNLIRLKLCVHEYRWQVLPYLLECSPNLITFVYCPVLATTTNDKRKLHQPFREPKCLMSHLEEIQLFYFKGCAAEMKMVSYFLKNAAGLKKISIRPYYLGSKNEVILKKLLMFPRSCQIAFE